MKRNLSADPLWYKDAIIYELRVRSFADSDADGVGDFKGLTQRLGYLQDLGVTAVWLLPFYPSPGKDDGYDIADYFDVDPQVGTLDDFREFLEEAHRRGLRVITELVINHTSDAHAWFQRARRAPEGSNHRDFYVWSDTPEKYKDARIIFQDFETSNWTWDPVAKAYFWHRFYSHQPDLNFDNPAVHEAVFGILDFWLDMGVDGLRLDAIPYLYEREGTSCENLPETHEFLRKLRRHVDEKYENRMLLAEANQWPEDAAAYFGDGDECHMNFHFPIMPRIFMSIHQEDRFPIIDILAQTPKIHHTAQWALFLRNHDELTLEMVTDEERDYMYSAYAHDPVARINLGIRRRLAPLAGNNRRVIELMNCLLFSLPGTPVIYYGDEIGMGDNIYLGDRNGVRTPMQWSADRNAGFSKSNPQRLILPVIIDPEYHFESINVEAQQKNPNSLLWWMKRLIALRNRFQAFGRGSIEFLSPLNPRVLAFIRKHEDETILVVANLSRFVQYVELDLDEYSGMIPVELFGRTEFPPIGELPYLLTLGGHSFYWFQLKKRRLADRDAKAQAFQPPTIEVEESWQSILEPDRREVLTRILPEWFAGQRWYTGSDRSLQGMEFEEVVFLPGGNLAVVIVRIDYAEGEGDRYLLAVGFEGQEHMAEVQARIPHSILAHVRSGKGLTGVLFDALADAEASRPLLDAILHRARLRGSNSHLEGTVLSGVERLEEMEARIIRGNEGNATFSFGDELFLKVYRVPEDGRNPELELGRWLSQRTPAAPVPPLIGTLEQVTRIGEPRTLATLFPYIPNEGDTRVHTREELGRYFERALMQLSDGEVPPIEERGLVELSEAQPPPLVAEQVGSYLDTARLVGFRTAELHRALTSDSEDEEAFALDDYSPMDQRSTYQTVRNVAGTAIRQLRIDLDKLSPFAAPLALEVLNRTDDIYGQLTPLLVNRLTAKRARLHGSLDLRNILSTGKDVVIVDLEGDRRRALAERRRKRSPLRDVAAMVRAYHRMSTTVFFDPAIVREEDRPRLQPWAEMWATWVSASYLAGYRELQDELAFLPETRDELTFLLDIFILEITLTELRETLKENPLRADVPLQNLVSLLERHLGS